ncbi:hypothetical protein FQN60_005192 [Etheostoma spectabile]|uniref:SRCR domain-containing protein n=1 Tax=Etheostoma spectabile TaxID=54343 RepID=A0A5J5DMD3_9PERO|nr:hypothetical protein FQN60_013144 [Etheostoma spectabile]KAA8594358.1 hypothetical protein FQN60_005192 [Etheostoma spectabile]
MVHMDKGHLLVLLLLLLWSSELQTEGKHNSEESVRLEGGRCTGTLQLKHHEEWRPVNDLDSVWTLRTAAVACRELDCGSAVSVEQRKDFSYRSVWDIRSYCVESGSALKVEAPIRTKEFQCGGNEAALLDCGSLGSDGNGPMRTKEFQCGGNERALLDCRSSGSDRNNCSSGKAVGLTCSDSRPFIIKAVVLLLTLLLVNVALYFYYKASRGRQTDTQEDIELNDYHLGVPAVEEGQTEEEGTE